MVNNTIENIYSDFRTNYIDKPDSIIEFYEKNAIYLSNIIAFKDQVELKLYIEMIAKYIQSIQLKGRWNLTIDLANKHLIFIDNEIERLNAHQAKDVWYNDIFFIKGIANYKLKEYKDVWYNDIFFIKGIANYKLKEYNAASKIFEKLVEVDNRNDNYKLWLKHAEFEENMWLIRLLAIISGSLIIISIFFEKYIPSYTVRMSIGVMALTGMSISFIYEYYMRLKFRKFKNKL